MKKKIQLKLTSIILSFALLFSFSVPAFATTATPTYQQIPKSTQLQINNYDVVAVFQGNSLVVWTRNPADKAIQDMIANQILNYKGASLGLGNVNSIDDRAFFSGYISKDFSDIKNSFGIYSVTKDASGNEYFNVNSLDKISHFIVGTCVFPTPPPVLQAVKATKVINVHGTAPTTNPLFGFTLKDGGNEVGTASTSAAGEVTFSLPGFVLPTGTNTKTLMMTEDRSAISANWTYDSASYTVTVHSDGTVSYSNSNGTPIVGFPTFTNTYTAPVTPPVLQAIKATKVINVHGTAPTTNPLFGFTLKDGGNEVGTASISTAGEVTFSLPGFVLPTGSDTKVLTMAETPDPTAANWAYDSASYTVTVHSDGTVSYANSSGPIGGFPTFTNTYTAPVTPVLQAIKATKVINGNPEVIPTFGFTLKDGANEVGTASINAAGTVTFSLPGFTLPTSGTKTLTMTEDRSAVPANWTYDSASYTVTIASDGTVSYAKDGSSLNGALPTFTNTYTAPVTPPPVLQAIKATKAITVVGTVSAPSQTFGFTLKDGDNEVGAASISAAGEVTFNMVPSFELPASGTKNLTMAETPDPTVANWTYDSASYTVTIASDGTVSYANSNGSPLNGSLPTFTNTYTAPGTPVLHDIKATKAITVVGAASAPSQTFHFTLKDEANTVGTAFINTAGEFTFSLPDFTLPTGSDTKILTMAETPDSNAANWTYDSASYTVTIHSDGTVSYAKNGSPLDGLPTFTNTYTTPGTPPVLQAIKATKAITVVGTASAPSQTFHFTLKDEANTVGLASISAAGTVTFSLPEFALPTGSGTKVLTMAEDRSAVPTNWAYDSASYTVTIHSDGTVSYAKNGSPLDGLPTFTNTYTAPTGGTTNNNNNNNGGTPTQTVPTVPETIPDPTVPLANPAVPTKAPQTSGETIPNENTPLASPKTGETPTPISLFVLLGLGGIGFAVSEILKRRKVLDK